MAFQNNNNNAPVTSPDWSIQAVKRMTFDGRTGTGAVGTGTLFTVTGTVLMRLFGKVVSIAGPDRLRQRRARPQDRGDQ
jgi:hypothetical protein